MGDFDTPWSSSSMFDWVRNLEPAPTGRPRRRTTTTIKFYGLPGNLAAAPDIDETTSVRCEPIYKPVTVTGVFELAVVPLPNWLAAL